jgi:hypothetical protein
VEELIVEVATCVGLEVVVGIVVVLLTMVGVDVVVFNRLDISI